MKRQKKKHYIYIGIISSLATYFLYTSARASAVAERGTNAVLGGEILLLLLPIIAILTYDNIILTRKIKAKSNRKAKSTGIHITGIKSIQEVN